MELFRIPLPFNPAVGPGSASYRQVPQQKSPYLIQVEASGTVYQLSVGAKLIADRLLDNTLYLEMAPENPQSTIIHLLNSSSIFCPHLHIIQHHHPLRSLVHFQGKVRVTEVW